MNYLAHAVLSFENAPVMVGQFIADDVKGNQWMRYDAEIQRGILLHRFIDDFTDHHAAVLLLKSRLYVMSRHWWFGIVDGLSISACG